MTTRFQVRSSERRTEWWRRCRCLFEQISSTP